MKSQPRQQWLGGIILVMMGLAAVLSLNGISLWGLSPWLLWGLLLPAVAGLVIAYQRLQENGGQVDGRFLRQNLWLLFPLVVAAFFIFNINWAYLGAVFFIGIGLALLAGQPGEQEA